MNVTYDYNTYIENLENRRLFVQDSLISLGKIGSLIHPIKVVKLRLEKRKLDKIDADITKISGEFDSLKSEYNSFIELQDVLGFYMERNPIDENGISLVKRVKKL